MDMFAVGLIDLGLTAAEYIELTPTQFWALERRMMAREERMDQRFAHQCSVMANIHRSVDKKPTPFTVEDFMPQRGSGPTPKGQFPKPAQTPEEMVAVLKAMPFGKWSVENG